MSAMEMSPAAQCAARGAILLDEIDAHWADHIDVGRLNIQSGRDCVLAQLFGEYPNGIAYVQEKRGGVLNVAHNGFTLGADVDFTDLTGAWRELIEARRAAQ